MSIQYQYRHEERPVWKWVELAMQGQVKLVDFQRSFVWDSKRKKQCKYIKAIIDGRPVNQFLLLEAASPPQFATRDFNDMVGIATNTQQAPQPVAELLLDGQQRLTSLLQALYGRGKSRFFAKLEGLGNTTGDLSVSSIEHERKRPSSPVDDYARDYIPLDVLGQGVEDDRGLSPLDLWCQNVSDSLEHVTFPILKSRIDKLFREVLFSRNLHYCILPQTTDVARASAIFVETNESPERITHFDLAVAGIRGTHGTDLRSAIGRAVSGNHSDLRHYFSSDEEKWIPEVGEWLLKVACLHTGTAPRETAYLRGLEHVMARVGSEDGLESVFADLSWAIAKATNFGVATRKMLPSWPPLHVFAALRQTCEGVRSPTKHSAVRSLLARYYWHGLFSGRYERDANQRLLHDFEDLRDAIAAIMSGAEVKEPRLFSEDLDGEDELIDAGWITRSRRGKAMLSLVLSLPKTPEDWVTGERMNERWARSLETDGKLDRHHIFPKKLLAAKNIGPDWADRALNGVVLDSRSNRHLAKHDPEIYVDKVVEDSHGKIGHRRMQARVHSHLVPYEEMVSNSSGGKLKTRYEKFLRKRAKMVAQEIERRTSQGGNAES